MRELGVYRWRRICRISRSVLRRGLGAASLTCLASMRLGHMNFVQTDVERICSWTYRCAWFLFVLLCDLGLGQTILALGADYWDGDKTMGLKAARTCTENKQWKIDSASHDGVSAWQAMASPMHHTLGTGVISWDSPEGQPRDIDYDYRQVRGHSNFLLNWIAECSLAQQYHLRPLLIQLHMFYKAVQSMRATLMCSLGAMCVPIFFSQSKPWKDGCSTNRVGWWPGALDRSQITNKQNEEYIINELSITQNDFWLSLHSEHFYSWENS